MKSKIFRFVLPAFALFLAVSFAFATEANNTVTTQYYDHPILGAQEVPISLDCPTEGTTTCKYNGFNVYADQGLSISLYERQ